MRSERRRIAILAVVGAAIGLGGCTEVERAIASVKTFNFMHEAPSFDPYEAPREAPPLSVPLDPRGGAWEPEIARTEAALRAWGDTMTNPLGMDERVLRQGAESYQTYCAVCHGTTAVGDGPIVGPGLIPFATNLLLPATQARSDGYIYAIIRIGRGLMPSYRRIPTQERWAVVSYLRYLQGGGDPIAVELPGLVQPGGDQFNTVAPATGTTGTDTTAGQE